MDEDGNVDFASEISNMVDFPAEVMDARRGTLVGTANYCAPEMIKDQISCMGTDLWTLGCIIFKMRTGKVPFSGVANHVIWPKILNRQIEWPKDL